MNTLYHEWIARQQHEQMHREAKRRDGWRLYGSLEPTGLGGWFKRLTGEAAVGEASPVVHAEPTQGASTPKGKRAG